jgi:hypothetical protein
MSLNSCLDKKKNFLPGYEISHLGTKLVRTRLKMSTSDASGGSQFIPLLLDMPAVKNDQRNLINCIENFLGISNDIFNSL